MRNKLSVISHLPLVIVFFAVVLLILPVVVSAHTKFPYWAQDGLVSCTGGSCPLSELTHTAIHIIYFGMTIALFVAAPILFAWGGIMIMIAGGDPGKLGQGKKIITGTIIGVLITLSSFLIVETFVNLMGIGGVGGFS